VKDDLHRRVRALELAQLPQKSPQMDPAIREFLDWILFPNGGPGEPDEKEQPS
jgi:hypothetical protein